MVSLNITYIYGDDWGMVQMIFWLYPDDGRYCGWLRNPAPVDGVFTHDFVRVSTILLVVQDFAGPSIVHHDISHMQPMVLEYESQHVPHKNLSPRNLYVAIYQHHGEHIVLGTI